MARPAQGTETHRGGGAEDGRVRRYGGAGEAPDLRQGGGAAARVRVVRGGAVHSGGGHLHPQDSQRGAARGGGRALRSESTRLNSSHTVISYAVFCLKKKKTYK